MFSKWINEYQAFSKKTRIVSKFGAFLISIFTLLSLYDLVKALYFDPSYFDSIWEMGGAFPAIIFQISILAVFLTRFILLFLNSKRMFWVNQILWLIGVSIFIGYWFYPIMPPSSEIDFTIYGNRGIFAHGSSSLDFFGWSYLILSPLLRISLIIISSVKYLKRNDKLNFNRR